MSLKLGYVTPYSVDVNLISTITRLPRVGTDPLSLLEKENKPTQVAKVKDRYDLVMIIRGFSISSIGDPSIRMATTILSHKMLHTL